MITTTNGLEPTVLLVVLLSSTPGLHAVSYLF